MFTQLELNDKCGQTPYVQKGDTFEMYRPAYLYGAEAECRYGTDRFDRIEGELERDWHNRTTDPAKRWKHIRDAVRDSCDRSVQIRRARDVPEACDPEIDD